MFRDSSIDPFNTLQEKKDFVYSDYHEQDSVLQEFAISSKEILQETSISALRIASLMNSTSVGTTIVSFENKEYFYSEKSKGFVLSEEVVLDL